MPDKKTVKEKLQCIKCTKERDKERNYYNTRNPLYELTAKIPICKQCIKGLIDYSNMETIYSFLRQFDIMFDIKYWEKAVANKDDTFGRYITMANSLPQFDGMGWNNSIFKMGIDESENRVEVKDNKTQTEVDINESSINLQPDVEMIKKWGKKFEPEDYFKLEDFYSKMMDANKIETPQDETYLKKLSVISLKMDKELEAGNYGQVKQLGDLFSKYMADSKFRAMDQTDASKTGGLRTFSQIYAEVEKDEFIPPWEEYRKIKGLKQDIVDKTIMHILNYTLKLNKAPQLIEPPDGTPDIEEE